MGWWKADPVPAPEQPSVSQPISRIPTNHPPVAAGVNQDSCPVDDKTRQIWLQAAQKQRQQARDAAVKDAKSQQQGQDSCPVDPSARQSWLGMASGLFGATKTSAPAEPPKPSRPSPAQTKEILTPPTSQNADQCSSDTIADLPEGPNVTFTQGKHKRTLSHERETSTIPRGQSIPGSTIPSNNEQETGRSESGKWIYPSETQFFNAVMRKSTTTTTPEELATSVSSIIPIHNAVNERAWHMIKKWEGDSSKACGGPKLLSFQGLGAGALSPKAKWNSTVMGAKEPFDRHDWIVERCNGQTVEYVIDFYQGKERDDADPRRRAQELNFYLDVRPKLNSLEGWKMRAEKWAGWR